DYKYSPVRSHDLNKTSQEKQNIELDSSKSEYYFGYDNLSKSSEINISSDLEDINMSEVDIEMVNADYEYDSSLYYNNELFNDPFLYDLSLLDFIDPSLIDTSFSFIDPSLFDTSLEFSNDT